MFLDQTFPDTLLRILVLGPLSLLWIAWVVRLIGLRSFSKMTAFDFITTVATGSLLGNAAAAGSWTGFFIANGAMLALLAAQAGIAELRVRSVKWLRVVENEPIVLMREGVMDEETMNKTRVTKSDLLAKLREANVLDFSQVRAVVLETTGDISVLHGDHLNEELLRVGQEVRVKDGGKRSSGDLAEERTEKAGERTDFAEDRTLLANERTFAGWGRTAFASIGLGLGFQALFKTAEPTWVPKCIATLFILLGILLIWLAERRADRLLDERTGNHVILMSRKIFRIMAFSVTVGGMALIASIWFLVSL